MVRLNEGVKAAAQYRDAALERLKQHEANPPNAIRSRAS